jgi:hypothetical protein
VIAVAAAVTLDACTDGPWRWGRQGVPPQYQEVLTGAQAPGTPLGSPELAQGSSWVTSLQHGLRQCFGRCVPHSPNGLGLLGRHAASISSTAAVGLASTAWLARLGKHGLANTVKQLPKALQCP